MTSTASHVLSSDRALLRTASGKRDRQFWPDGKGSSPWTRQQSDIRRLADLRLSELNAAWPEVGVLRVYSRLF